MFRMSLLRGCYLYLSFVAIIINATVDQPKGATDHELAVGSTSRIGRSRQERASNEIKKAIEEKVKRRWKHKSHKKMKFSDKRKCARNAESECTDTFLESTKEDTALLFPVTEVGIMTVCLNLQALDFCIKSIPNDCSDNYHSRQVQSEYVRLATVLHDLCPVGGRFRDAILKHNSCYTSIDNDRKVCEEKFRKKMLSSIRRRECFATKTFVDCYAGAASRNCTANSTAVLIERYYERAILAALPFCNSSAYSITTPGFFILMLLFIAVSNH